MLDSVIKHIDDLNYYISLNLDGYTLDRLSVVDRNIIRLGSAEMLYLNEPKEIVINEMINMSREYSETKENKSSRFNNAILDKIAKMSKDE